MDEEMVLCAASSYEQKYYLNPEFESLPEAVKQELQIMCVLYTADVGGVLLLVFDENGNLELKVEHNEGDFSFDEIGSVLKIEELQDTSEHIIEATFSRLPGNFPEELMASIDGAFSQDFFFQP